MWILSIVCSEISDFLMRRGYISIGVGRKIFNSIGLWIPAALLIALGYVSKENTSLAVVLLTAAIAFNSASFVGYLINHMDLSPNFAGTLMGCTNASANVFSILGPMFVGFVVTDAVRFACTVGVKRVPVCLEYFTFSEKSQFRLGISEGCNYNSLIISERPFYFQYKGKNRGPENDTWV